jgi:hypothetical protein
VYEDQPDLARQPGGIGCGVFVNHLCPAVAGGGGMSDFWKDYEPEPSKPAPMTKDELTEPLGCVVVRPLVANRATPPAAPVQEPFGYVWFTKHMEHRFTRMKPHPDMGAMNIKPVYTAPPGQEPVAYTTGHCKEKAQPGGCQLHNLHCGYPACDRKAVTTPPAAQRPWVGLTDEEIAKLDCYDHLKFARAIEAKLRSKNNG